MGEDGYDSAGDVEGSLAEAYAIRARVAAGGPGWLPQQCECPGCRASMGEAGEGK